MIRVMLPHDPVKHLEHRLELDRTVHDGERTFSKGGAEPPDRCPLGGLSGPNHNGGRAVLEPAEELQDPLPGGLTLTVIEGDAKIHDRDVNGVLLEQISRLVGRSHPETVDPERLEEAWKLVSEVLLLPPAVAEHEPQTLPGRFLIRCGRGLGHAQEGASTVPAGGAAPPAQNPS